MNCLVREVLKEVIFGLLIMEPHSIKNRGRRRRRTMMPYQVLRGNRLFRCHKKETKWRERERERERRNIETQENKAHEGRKT